MTKPKLKTFDAPPIEVIVLANKPPVQDSTTANFKYYLFKIKNNLFIKFTQKEVQKNDQIKQKLLQHKFLLINRQELRQDHFLFFYQLD